MKKLIFLLLLTISGYGQTLPNPKYGNITTNTLKILTPATVTSTPSLTTTEANGLQKKIDPVNLPFARKLTITQIRLLSGVLSNPNFLTTDIGQEGNWYYDSTDTTTPDNTGTVLVTADGKRIKRIYSGAVNVAWYGIFPNLITDFSENIVTVLGLHNELFFPEGNYNISISTANSFSNKILRGVKPSWNGTTIVGGSKIIGNIAVVGSDNFFSNLGIFNLAGNGITIRTNGSRNLIENCIFNVQDHGVLIEQFGGTATNNIVRFCDSYGGIHGFVSKSKNATFFKCRAFTPSQDGFALVSDNITGTSFPSMCLSNSLIDCEVYNTNTGVAIYSRDYTSTTNANNIILRNIRIIGGNIDTCSAYGIRIGDEASSPVGQTYNDAENVSITGISIQNTTTKNISVARSNNTYIGGNNFRGIVERFNSTFAKNYKFDTNNNFNSSIGNSIYNTVNTINATTIDASLINEYLETNNTVTTVITGISNGKVGQIIKLLINDDFTTIQKGSTIRLSKTYIKGKGSFVLLKRSNDASGWDEIFSDCVANYQSFGYNSSLTIDYNFANNAEVNLTGDVSSLIFSNMRVGVTIKLIIQATTSTRLLNGWDNRIIWLNSYAPTSVGIDSRLALEFFFNGTNIVNISRSDFAGIAIAPNLTGSTAHKLSQKMNDSDYWAIYGRSTIEDQGVMVFEVGDNGNPLPATGQSFEFKYSASGGGVAKTAMTIDYNTTTVNGSLVLGMFTVATLPTPDTSTAYATVSDALAPSYLATVVGGGAIKCPVFWNGSSWVAH